MLTWSQKDLKDQKSVLQKEHTEYKALPNKLGMSPLFIAPVSL